MSDYITNLVARTLNSAATIQPRLPSLFEPMAQELTPAAPIASDTDFTAPLVERCGDTESSLQVVSSRTPPHSSQTIAGIGDRPEPVIENSSDQESPSPTAIVGTNITPNPTYSQRTARSQRVQKGDEPVVHLHATSEKLVSTAQPRSTKSIFESKPPATPVGPLPSTAKSIFESKRPATPVGPLPSTAKSVFESKRLATPVGPLPSTAKSIFESKRPATPVGPLPLAGHSILESKRLVTRVGQHPLAEVPVQLRVAEQLKPGREAAIASAPPTVRVTIGRIDVRAIMPPVPAKRAVPQQRGSTQSLEEYLKQRSENRR
jgi:hypothetical protein